MKDIIDILLYISNFIELSRSNQIFGQTQGLFSLPSARQARRKKGPYVLSGGPLIFNVILFKRKAVYTEGAGPVCKCTGQCTLEGSILLF